MNLIRWARVHWDRVGGGVLAGIGGVFLIVGWNRVSNEALTAQQVPYIISGGIGGLFLLGIGATLWLSADLRDEWRKLDQIERSMSPDRGLDAPKEDDPFTHADRAEADETEDGARHGSSAPNGRRSRERQLRAESDR